ncbi:MAG TPA: septal ring lytic transglycosylase RlpA family protein [Aliidongia sp.]|nr:septal ring lytic transglycosylase RlpA family protein [Aliidongia sp.]
MRRMGAMAAASVALALVTSGTALAEATPADTVAATPQAKSEAKKLDAQPAKPPPGKEIKIDHSGRKESGKASFYASHFTGKKTASGKRLSPHDHVAASKTLPLGTTAKVTNLDTGKSTVVKIEDRGPFGKGRVVDVTPKVAQEIGLGKGQGVAPVVVAPIQVP